MSNLAKTLLCLIKEDLQIAEVESKDDPNGVAIDVAFICLCLNIARLPYFTAPRLLGRGPLSAQLEEGRGLQGADPSRVSQTNSLRPGGLITVWMNVCSS